MIQAMRLWPDREWERWPGYENAPRHLWALRKLAVWMWIALSIAVPVLCVVLVVVLLIAR
jgi:hypothetical protein